MKSEASSPSSHADFGGTFYGLLQMRCLGSYQEQMVIIQHPRRCPQISLLPKVTFPDYQLHQQVFCLKIWWARPMPFWLSLTRIRNSTTLLPPTLVHFPVSPSCVLSCICTHLHLNASYTILQFTHLCACLSCLPMSCRKAGTYLYVHSLSCLFPLSIVVGRDQVLNEFSVEWTLYSSLRVCFKLLSLRQQARSIYIVICPISSVLLGKKVISTLKDQTLLQSLLFKRNNLSL